MRQLQHVVERLTILADRIDAEAVLDALTAMDSREKPVETLADAEEDQIRKVLAATGGNKSKAAADPGNRTQDAVPQARANETVERAERLRPDSSMIDIHSHILPGLDDGSKSLEESVAMLRMAAAAGTTDIVASPHANQEYEFDPLVVEQKISELAGRGGRFAADSLRLRFPSDAGEYRGLPAVAGEVLDQPSRLPAGGVFGFFHS